MAARTSAAATGVAAPRLGAMILVCLAAACGDGSMPSQPQPDFTLSVAPSETYAVVGNSTGPVGISVAPQNGFTGTVTITLQGLPPGVGVSPSPPFQLAAAATQFIVLDAPTSATLGMSSVAVVAAAGALSHRAQLTLTTHPQPSVRTYQDGSVLYLESSSGGDTARIGLETNWGGSIVELSHDGTSFVNAHDTGREVQPAFREGNDLNWNPTLGGDVYDQGTPTQAYTLTPDSLYTRAQSLQWSPDFYGGGPGHPVAGNMLVEQTITAVLGQLHTFKVHYKATHLGADLHANSIQELPAVYSNQNYDRFVYYGGVAPWTNETVTATQFPNLPQFSPILYVPEHWGAFVDAQNQGVTLYAPSRYPYTLGFAAPDPGPGGQTDNATNYFLLADYLTISPHMVFETDVYLIAGDLQEARQSVYQLHQILGAPDIFAPTGATDSPGPGSTISGVTVVTG